MGEDEAPKTLQTHINIWTVAKRDGGRNRTMHAYIPLVLLASSAMTSEGDIGFASRY